MLHAVTRIGRLFGVITARQSIIKRSAGIIESAALPAISTRKTVILRPYSSGIDRSDLTEVAYNHISGETLESLADKFSELVDDHQKLSGADVTLSDGVLTVYLGPDIGTYVINKQSPNKQIWLSSPISGPARFDHCPAGHQSGSLGDCWIYSHTGETLHKVLDVEIGEQILKTSTRFQEDCYLGGLDQN